MHGFLYTKERLEVRQLVLAYVVTQVPKIIGTCSESALDVAFQSLVSHFDRWNKLTLHNDMVVGGPGRARSLEVE